MKVVFANIPFYRLDYYGRPHTGPNAGSRWPWTIPGYTDYACFPFYMGYAAAYLKHHGLDVAMLDGVAKKIWTPEQMLAAIYHEHPDMLVMEAATPTVELVLGVAAKMRYFTGCKVVLTGPHGAVYADDLLRHEFINAVVVGEYERGCLALAQGDARRKIVHEQLDNIDTLPDGSNFLPLRPLDSLWQYWEPTQRTPRTQLQVMTARSCPAKCAYCQWPVVMNNRRFRQRKVELVIDEIKTVIRQVAAGVPVRSILYDDDTWNVGPDRVRALCDGHKDIGLPWSFMGRTDTLPLEDYDAIVDAGCVGMRFGVESFQQHVLDRVCKRDAAKTRHFLDYILRRYRGIQYHLTTMKNMPGETLADWKKDEAILLELKAVAESYGNSLTWQNSDCIAFPGTPLWEELKAQGKSLENFALYNGNAGGVSFGEAMGWLGKEERNDA